MAQGHMLTEAVYWIEIDKIIPNPYQPRREFDPESLRELSESIRQYGVLQPLVVSKIESPRPDGGVDVRYELIAGERRLRASKLAELRQVPAVVRVGDDSQMKLELAILENLQREDLNPIDRARSFERLVREFKMTHAEIGKKMGKSREYVSNSLRLLSLPSPMIDALSVRKISEGHTRPLMMLVDRPTEQMNLFKEIINRKISVRESERIARRIAHEKVRREHLKVDPKILLIERQFSESLGTRVQIENGEHGGKIVIDFSNPGDLEDLLRLVRERADFGTGKLQQTSFNTGFLSESLATSLPNPPVHQTEMETIEHESDLTVNQHELTDIDDVELDIVSDPARDIPPHYHSIFAIPGGTIEINLNK